MNELNKQTPDPQLLQNLVSGSRFVPMFFYTGMVQAILNGTKTETRRPINLPTTSFYHGNTLNDKFIACFFENNKDENYFLKKPKLYKNDIIWVRETFCNDERGSKSGIDDCYYYKADMLSDKIWAGFWSPSIHMPKKACRIFLKVVSVHVERLQDIDEQSAINEGIENLSADEFKVNLFRNYLRSDNEINYKDFTTTNPIASYQTLWQKINGKDSWDLNPYVFVYKFERIERPHDFR